MQLIYFLRAYITSIPPVRYMRRLYTAGAIPYAELDRRVPAMNSAIVPFCMPDSKAIVIPDFFPKLNTRAVSNPRPMVITFSAKASNPASAK